MTVLEKLVRTYISEQSKMGKDRALKDILNFYAPYISLLCSRYRGIEEREVIQQHVHIGIFMALKDFDMDFENIYSTFTTHIMNEVYSNVVRQYYSKKRYNPYNIEIDIVSRYLESEECVEDEVILKVDVENAIKQLPAGKRWIVNMWMLGYTLNSIKNNFSSMMEGNAESIFYDFKMTLPVLRQQLAGYACAC